MESKKHVAVVDIDVGKKDLQQCADATMRLRAEYQFATNQKDNIVFTFTSGDQCSYSKWKEGYRPKINGNSVSFIKSANADNSYSSFKKYMEIIFSYCGTYSLSKELEPVNDYNTIEPGDVFIIGGFPGHAVTVMDVAENVEGKRIFLISQSYMPAQDIHILINPNNAEISPWYEIPGGELKTPEWTFPSGSLMRF